MCREKPRCQDKGECTAVDGNCAVSSDEDCRTSDRCKLAGNCTVSTVGWNACCATRNEDCRASENCKTMGLCELEVVDEGCGQFQTSQEGCQATSDSYCLASKECAEKGLRGAKDGQCEATTDEGCRASTLCAREGRCSAGRGRGRGRGICVANTDTDCGASELCKNEGRCFWRPGENECVEKTDLGTCEGQAAMWNVTNSASRCVNDEDCPLPQSDDDLTHCHHSPPGGACRVYEVDCPVGTFESHGHYCYPGCSDGCPIGLLCFDHLCFPQECFSRSDCPAPYACRDGQCERPSCADGKCCPPPFRCARGEEICVEPPAR